ncbi:MAG: hypothetical protein KatS3mg108_0910 [Isosphaeraceae bacterium]|jgi:hypothetical protein|nr:MAG: hypothetical protein KatS3mg108_0910 [Isosphaeraceae bacterium]
MRLARMLCLLSLVTGAAPVLVGCSEGTEIAVEKAPPVQAPPPVAPPSGEIKKFGGAGSSSAMTQDPGAST